MVECANFLAQRGHDVYVYASDWDETVLVSRVKRQHVPMPRNHLYRLLRFTGQVQRQMVLLSSMPEAIGTFGVLSPPGALVWAGSVHGAWLKISASQRSFRGRFRQRINPIHYACIALEKKVYGDRTYGRMLALSPSVQQDLERLYSVPESDVTVLPQGYSPTEFNISEAAVTRSDVRSRLGYTDLNRVVIFVANELERKGFWQLARAIAALKDPSVKLLAVGRLNPRACIPGLRHLGLENNVIFAGPSSNVAQFYAAADVFVLPTQYEAWGLVIVEAMACGLPVLTSRLAGAAIAVREGVSGFLLDDPTDVGEISSKLSSILYERLWCSSDISASVHQFAWSEILLRYEEELLKLAEERR